MVQTKLKFTKIVSLLIILVVAFGLFSCKRDKKQYTVTFMCENTVFSTVKVTKGKTVQKPATNPTKEGFIFKYWTNGEAEYIFSTPVTTNLTLNAFFEESSEPAPDEKKLAGGVSGALYNYKYADDDTRSEIAAVLERWLINESVSIPVAYSVGMTIYSNRVKFPVDEYVPLMGWGSLYGGVTTGTASGSDTDPAYRLYTGASPKTLFRYDYRDSVESEIFGYIEGSLWDIGWNEDFTGYEMLPNFGDGLATAVRKNRTTGEWEDIVPEGNEQILSRNWKVKIREGLKYSDGTEFDIDDIIYSLKIALDPTLKNYRGTEFYSGSLVISGAEEYYKQYSTSQVNFHPDEMNSYTKSWDTVGIKKVDDYTMVISLDSELNSWDFHYNTASIMFAPLSQTFFENKLEPVDPNDLTKGYEVGYGKVDKSVISNVLTSGEYILSYYEDDKSFEFKRNKYFSQNEAIHHPIKVDVINYKIIKDPNAALNEFKLKNLDVCGIPATEVENYRNDKNVKRTPDSTVWRLSTNQSSQEYLDQEFPGNNKTVSPLMQSKNFMWALYLGLDRESLAEQTLKTYNASQYYVNDAYLLNGETGVSYRGTTWAEKVGQGIFEDDFALNVESSGYSSDDARHFYVQALDELIAAGKLSPGSRQEPVLLELKFVAFDGSPWEEALTWMANAYEEIFNAQTKYPYIRLKFKTIAAPEMDLYYEYQMKGDYDLALAGINGSTMDLLGLYDVFSSNAEENGLRLSLGVDTESTTTVEYDGMLWSYDALVSAANGPTYVVNGVISKEYKVTMNLKRVPAFGVIETIFAEYGTYAGVGELYDKALTDLYDALMPEEIDEITNKYLKDVEKIVESDFAYATDVSKTLLKAKCFAKYTKEIADHLLTIDLDAYNKKIEDNSRELQKTQEEYELETDSAIKKELKNKIQKLQKLIQKDQEAIEKITTAMATYDTAYKALDLDNSSDPMKEATTYYQSVVELLLENGRTFGDYFA